jgi:hypothetical protein
VGKRSLEARAGIEPALKGFADLPLTAWVPRRLVSAVNLGRTHDPWLQG